MAGGAHLAGTLMDEDSSAHQVLGVVGTTASGSFLYLIARSTWWPCSES